MFFRQKTVKGHTYVQIVENRWEQGRTRQRVLATLGRLDQLQESGGLEVLLESGSRFSGSLLVLSEHRRGELPAIATRRIGAPRVFERLWRETGCAEVIDALLLERKFEFPVERAIFLEVLHRLVSPGSDRSGVAWREVYGIDGVEELDLHHAYRAMAWLGEPLEEETPQGALAPRCTKDRIEEALFARDRDLFSGLQLVFFDTTSIYFEGEGGETLGRFGHSKDHRKNRKQMVVGVVLDQEGRPICCELWPGNTTDVTTLVPVAERLRQRFGIGRVCLIADRGMVREETLQSLETSGWDYIVGTRMRNSKEVRDEVLGRAGAYQKVFGARTRAKDPSPLEVKEVWVGERRYVVCRNQEHAAKDRADREAILASLEQRLRQGATSLVGNRGYRRYLSAQGRGFRIDPDKIERDQRYDGKWVLRTTTDLEPADVALAYKQLWTVEEIFRTMKSLLETRPVYHRTDEAIRGHVFCSFLALRLRSELEFRLAERGESFEWMSIIRDLDRVEEIEIAKYGNRFLLRTEAPGVAGKVFQAAGVALPPTIRQMR
jgi:transposase